MQITEEGSARGRSSSSVDRGKGKAESGSDNRYKNAKWENGNGENATNSDKQATCECNPFKNPWKRASTETSEASPTLEVSLEIERIISKLQDNTKPQPAPETGQSSTQAPEVREKNQIDAMMENLMGMLPSEREKFNLTNRRMSKERVEQYADALKQVLQKKNITSKDLKNTIDGDIQHYQENLKKGSLTRTSWQRLTDYTTMLKQIKNALDTKTN